MTFVQHFQKIDQPAPSLEQQRQWQADLDKRFQTKLEQVEAQWAERDKTRVNDIAVRAETYARQYALDQANLQAERQVEARRQAETAAAIMGVFADLSQSAIGAAEDLNETRALVDRTNAASAGGFVARNTPYVAPPLTEEQRQLLASRWGRSGGKSVATTGSGQGNSGTSVSGSTSASEAEEPKLITQEEVEAIMTSRTFVTEDGSTFVTNGRFVELEILGSDRFWSPFMMPVNDMEVTSFGLGLFGRDVGDPAWNLQGRGICTRYLDMQSTSEGHKKIVDPETGEPALSVLPCTWNFVNSGPGSDYRFSSSPLLGETPK
jgi:hypothetical protein